MEQPVYALIITTRKLILYFLTHRVEVVTGQALMQVMQKSDATGRMMKWAMEMGQFDIRYRLRKSIKGQVVADFVVELSHNDRNEDEGK